MSLADLFSSKGGFRMHLHSSKLCTRIVYTMSMKISARTHFRFRSFLFMIAGFLDVHIALIFVFGGKMFFLGLIVPIYK